MSDVYDALREFLARAPWALDEHPQEQWLRFVTAGRNSEWLVYAFAIDRPRRVVIRSLLEPPLKEDVREQGALLATRINERLDYGSFEVDLDEGSVRFRTSLDLGHAPLDPRLLEPLLAANLATTDEWQPAWLAAANGASAAEVWGGVSA